MEDKLRSLIDASDGVKAATEWKEQGKGVIACFCSSYTPEELVYACGMLPWWTKGTRQTSLSHAPVYRLPNSCGYCTHVLESYLSGQLHFVDGVIGTTRCDDLRRLYDAWVFLDKNKPSFHYLLQIGYNDSAIEQERFVLEVSRLLQALEQFYGVQASRESLMTAIRTCNKTRSLLRRMYQMRKKEVPPVSGAEALAIVATATTMPKDQFNSKLEELLDYLSQRKAPVANLHPRLLVIGEMIDNPEHVAIIEEAGGLVVMDYLDLGARYFWSDIDEAEATIDPIGAIAKYYFTKPVIPRAFYLRRAEQVLNWAKEFSVDGIIATTDTFCLPGRFFIPCLERMAKETNVPMLTLFREYPVTGRGQIQTRVQAFLEMMR